MIESQIPIWEAELIEIIISPGHDYWVKKGTLPRQHGFFRLDTVECVAGRGLRGDRYFAKPSGHKGQVTFLQWEVIEEIKNTFELPDVSPAVFRRNLIVKGIDLSKCLGEVFSFQGVHFEGTQECKPCAWMDRVVAPGVRNFMKDGFRGGLRARVLNDGTLKPT